MIRRRVSIGPAVRGLAAALALSAAVAFTADGAHSAGEASWLGIFLGDALDGGAQVVAVVPGGPAARGGICRGDVVLGFGGRDTPDRLTLGEAVDASRPGDEVIVRVLRAGEVRDLRVRTGKIPAGADFLASAREGPAALWAPARDADERLARAVGARFAEIPDALRRHYGAPPDRGILVISIVPSTPAARSGLRVGDVVIAAAGRPAARAEDLSAALDTVSRGSPLELAAVREGRPIRAAIEGALTAPTRDVEIERLRRENERLRGELERARGGKR